MLLAQSITIKLLFFLIYNGLVGIGHVTGYFSPCRLSERMAFFERATFLPKKPPTHQNVMLNPIMTKAAGQLKIVAIIGCHKKGEQSNAIISPHGSM